MDDSYLQVSKTGLNDKKLSPQEYESDRCDTTLGSSILCRVLKNVVDVERVDQVQDRCPAWEKFRNHEEPQGYTLPCVLLRSQLMQRKR